MGSTGKNGVDGGGGSSGSFKILLIGDSGVGKSSLLMTFISDSVAHHVSPIVGFAMWEKNGVDFKIKHISVGGKKLRLTIWDTAGKKRFGTLTSSYYRGAHGIILVHEVTRKGTFENLSDTWAKEVELYSTNPECIKILVGNKESAREVTTQEGTDLARQHKCLFLECSARTRDNVHRCFKELIHKVPSLLEGASVAVKKQILRQKQLSQHHRKSSCCS